MQVIKNNGKLETFDAFKISDAVTRCFESLAPPFDVDHMLATAVAVRERVAASVANLPTLASEISVNAIHDMVERELLTRGEVEAARAYMRFRDEKRRTNGRPIPPRVRAAFDASAKLFPEPLQAFQFFDKYARWNPAEGRRETWPEATDRACEFLAELVEKNSEVNTDYYPVANALDRIKSAMLDLRVLPSMRLLAMAGEAGHRDNATLYNCSYQGVESPTVFVETLCNSMAGCGVGFSVERQFIDRMPEVGEGYEIAKRAVYSEPYPIEDSAEGWADALEMGLYFWFAGVDGVTFDYSQIRKAGEPLRTKGGVASGPEPLRRMLDYIRDTVLAAKGRKLRSLECHDIMCMIGDCAVQGGVRRSAMISLFDWDDRELRHCKAGNYWEQAPWRSNANNSAVWPDRQLSQAEVAEFLLDMDRGKSGEPGIFSRRVALATMPERRRMMLSDKEAREIGTNPCGEIVLLNGEFCNLSIAVARPGMSEADLLDAVELATIIGTIQSMATSFPQLTDKWTENCDRERLLGVDITGQMDLGGLPEALLAKCKAHAVETNRVWAERLGIPPSASVTCAKPSGNSSALLNTSPGINRRWSPFQIRRATVDPNGPMFNVLSHADAPMIPYGEKFQIEFPMAAPEGTPTTRERCAIAQLDYWKRCKVHYTEHNPSCTISYRPDELIEIMAWVHENQDIIGGLAFLPADDHVYSNAPNEAIERETFERLAAEFPAIDFAMLYAFEDHDTTTSARELACVAGVCDIL